MPSKNLPAPIEQPAVPAELAPVPAEILEPSYVDLDAIKQDYDLRIRLVEVAIDELGGRLARIEDLAEHIRDFLARHYPSDWPRKAPQKPVQQGGVPPEVLAGLEYLRTQLPPEMHRYLRGPE